MLTAGMVLVGGDVALLGWSNGRSGRLRVLCMLDLGRFIHDARIPLDNNDAERGMRRLAVGRKNHYGSKSLRGTQVAALYYSLIESAHRLGLDPKAYLLAVATAAIAEPKAVLLPRMYAEQVRASG